MKVYSLDLREKIVKTWEKGSLSIPTIAEKFDVGSNTVRRYVDLYKNTASLLPKKRSNKHLIKINKTGDAFLRKAVEKNKAITLKELKVKFKKKFGISVAEKTISRHPEKERISLKKSEYMSQIESDEYQFRYFDYMITLLMSPR